MKNILVTGGAGYIGSHFINAVLKRESDISIFVVDNFSQGENNKIKDGKVFYYNADLKDKIEIERIFSENKIDIVVHFAALASVPDSVMKPHDYYQNNIIGGLNLLDAMLKNKVDKIIFSSSASVYGEPISEIITEDHPKNPTNPYGYTKLIFENILKDYKKAYGLNSISFRYFCASGCDESGKIGEYHDPETHIIPSILNTFLGKRSEFHVYGNDFPTSDGSGVRDYIHVNDLADAHVLALSKLLSGENACAFYNLGINKGFSVFELIQAAEMIIGKKLNFKIKERRPGDPSRLIADSSKAQGELNWMPKYLSIEEIIKTAYNFFKSKI